MDRLVEIDGPRLSVDLAPVDNRVESGGGAWLFDRSASGHSYWSAESVISVDECQRIVNIGDLFIEHEGRTGHTGVDRERVRKSQVAWMFPGEICGWIFDRVGPIVADINRQMFGLDLYGFTQGMQFTRYRAPGSHYAWHMDFGPGNANRKLSMIVQLSDPADYEGGEVELFLGDEPAEMSKARGSMIVFPSFVMHRVKPVTAGERISLVAWLEGPALR